MGPPQLVECRRFMTVTSSFSVSPLRERTVLCADDHEQIATLAKRLLERAGHHVECVSDGRQAWDRIAAAPAHFDVVVIDQQMPHITGLELTARLRAIGFPGKIIIQSSRLTHDEECAFRAFAVDRILCKPAGVLRLVEVVQE
jgi:CheY-like chemotaxis protein